MSQFSNQPITKWQWFTTISSTLISIQLIITPRLVSEKADQDAWIVLLIAGGFAILGAGSYFLVSLRFPDLNIYQYSQVILGKFLGGFMVINTYIYLILFLGISTRVFAESIKEFWLNRTPSIVIIFSFLLVSFYLAQKGISTIVRVFDILFPIVIIGMLLIILLPLKQAHWAYILPMLPEGIGRVITGLPFALIGFINYGIIGFLMPHTVKKNITFGPLLGAVILATTIQVLITITAILFFGAEQLKHIVYPILAMTKGVVFPGTLVERIESSFIIAWVPISFTSISAHFYQANTAINHFFTNLNKRLVGTVTLILSLIIAMIPVNPLENLQYFQYVAYSGVFFAYIYVPGLLITALIRGVKSK